MITEFPEKWAMKNTEDIAEYLNKVSSRISETIYEKSEHFAHFPAISVDKGNDSEGNPRGNRLYHLFDTVQEGYTELTEEEFLLCMTLSDINLDEEVES